MYQDLKDRNGVYMNKEQLRNQYYESIDQVIDLQIKIEEFTQKWLDGEYNTKYINEVLEKANHKLDILKAQSNEYYKKYMMELEREHNLKSAKNTIRFQLGLKPDEIIITGGVASETHLIGREKSKEELIEEKEEAFASIRQMVATKQISLAQASSLKSQVELVYNSKLQEFSSKQK